MARKSASTRKKRSWKMPVLSARVVWGGFLVTVGLGEMALLAYSVGVSQGVYFWFYHLAVVGIGASLLLQDRALWTAFFSAGLLPMGAYLVEHVLRLFGVHTLGLTGFLYNPGLSGTAFLLGHSHFLFWPAAIYGWATLPTKKEGTPKLWIYLVIFHAAIWATSFYVFPPHQNVNCIHGPCFPWPWSTTALFYRFAYVGTLFTLNAALALFLWRETPVWIRRRAFGVRTRQISFGLASLFALATAVDEVRWWRTPHFRCEAAFEDSRVKAACDYTAEWDRDKMMLAYSIVNKASEPRYCNSRIRINGEEQPLHDAIWAEPKVPTEVWVVVPNPRQDTSARVLATCAE